MGLRRFLILITIAIVILLIIVVWFFPSDRDFRTDNPFWNGTKDIGSSYPAAPIESLSELPASPQGSTLILIPYLNFTSAELEALNGFVAKGGSLILADDYGYGNQILEYLGLKARFSGQTLLDPLVNYKNKWFPKIFNLKPSPFTSNTDSLVLNYATCLIGVNTDDTLALSSLFSFLDLNDNQVWDKPESTGPLPVISHHNLGSGQIILIADPSIFINSMESMEGNRNFIQNIVTATTSSLLIDQSHLPSTELHQTKNILTHIRDTLATPLGTIGLLVLALTITLSPIWHKRTTNPTLKGDESD
ncbi:DUF4350 domain-containing protein [Chloroflexota bacterium]